MEEVSLGDYILSGGEFAALGLMACVRLIPGVMGSDESPEEESFEQGLLSIPTTPDRERGATERRGAALRPS